MPKNTKPQSTNGDNLVATDHKSGGKEESITEIEYTPLDIKELEEKIQKGTLSATELDNEIWLTHLTCIAPQNGVMIPGNRCDVDLKNLSPIEMHLETLKFYPSLRMTIHWYPQELVALHSGMEVNNLGKYTNVKFVVIEKAKHLKSQMYGGYAEDFWIVGPYRLSADSMIFVPAAHMKEAKKTLAGFQGKIYSYADISTLEQTVRKIIKEKTQLEIHVPVNQTIKAQISVIDVMAAIKENPHDPALRALKPQVIEAQQNRKGMIEITDNCPPNQLKIIVNGKMQLARDFYIPWYRQKYFEKSHSESIFYAFEQRTNLILQPLMQFFNMYDKISNGGKEENKKSLDSFQKSFSKYVLENVTPENIEEVKKLFKQIKVELERFPTSVKNYIQDEWEINFNLWLDLLNEIYALTKKGGFTLTLLENKINTIAERVGASLSSDMSPVDQILADDLKSLNLGTQAFLNKKSYYVDIICFSLKPEEYTQALALHNELNAKGIRHQFGVLSKTGVSALTIFKTNVPNVRNGVRAAIEELSTQRKTA